MTLYPGSPKFGTDLDRIVQFYPVVAEGVLEADGPYAWRFRTTREYRGPGKSYYRVELASDCSLAPNEMKDLIGKPVFLLLSGGPERYEAGRCVNLLGGDVTAAIRDRYVESCVAR
jgi:hypothetical protein